VICEKVINCHELMGEQEKPLRESQYEITNADKSRENPIYFYYGKIA